VAAAVVKVFPRAMNKQKTLSNVNIHFVPSFRQLLFVAAE